MSQPHWDAVWSGRSPADVSWYTAEPTRSLALIQRVTDPDASVIDVGGGASTLVDALLAEGYRDVTVLDLASEALVRCQERLGDAGDGVDWVVGDVTTYEFDRHFDLWHDRAVLHFLTDADDQNRYANRVRGVVGSGGHVILATFAPTGPDQCSGLPVQRYDANMMCELLGADFETVDVIEETHVTPTGASQDFLYGLFRRH